MHIPIDKIDAIYKLSFITAKYKLPEIKISIAVIIYINILNSYISIKNPNKIFEILIEIPNKNFILDIVS
jgi:hypothetical protein